MTLEFHTPKEQVKEWILTFLMRRLLHLHHDRNISKAAVQLSNAERGQKTCAIDVIVHGRSHFFFRTCASFEEAALHVLYQLEEKLRQLIKPNPAYGRQALNLKP